MVASLKRWLFVMVGASLLALGFPAQAGTGTAKVTWTAPTQNSDGTAYSNPDGYYVYWGASADKLVKGTACVAPACNRINITAESTLTYTITGLDAGTYAVSVSAYNKLAEESALSAANTFSIARQVVPGTPGSVTVSVTVTAP